jgi:hypothetical protein
MSSTLRSSVLIRDGGVYCFRSPRCFTKFSGFTGQFRHIASSRGTRKTRKKVQLQKRAARVAWEQENRISLRMTLMRQYEEEERPKWAKKSHSFGHIRGEPRISLRSNEQQGEPNIRDNDVQCGIFWDIENVKNEYYSYFEASNLPEYILQPLSLKPFVISRTVLSLPSSKLTCHGPLRVLKPALTLSTPN